MRYTLEQLRHVASVLNRTGAGRRCVFNRIDLSGGASYDDHSSPRITDAHVVIVAPWGRINARWVFITLARRQNVEQEER